MLVSNKSSKIKVRRRRPVFLGGNRRFGQRLGEGIGNGLNGICSLIALGRQMRKIVGEIDFGFPGRQCPDVGGQLDRSGKGAARAVDHEEPFICF